MHLAIPAGVRKNWNLSMEGMSYQIRISNRLVVLKYGSIKGILMITIHKPFRQPKAKWMRSRALWEFQTGANVNS